MHTIKFGLHCFDMRSAHVPVLCNTLQIRPVPIFFKPEFAFVSALGFVFVSQFVFVHAFTSGVLFMLGF